MKCKLMARTASLVVRRLQSWSAGREEVRLRFRCTGCGKCCTGSGGRVRVNDRELQELATATDSSVVEFKRKYTRVIEENVGGHKRTQLVLKQTPDDRQCIFLQGSKCSVYQARPTQCRTFPWWPQHLVSDYDWKLAAADCEGIYVTQDKQDNVPVYTFDDVMPETILHDIHRSGENYTYDELHQMLRDLREVEPEFVTQYKAEFFDKFSRRIVFSDDEVTVLDTFFDGAMKPTRSFVFNDRLHLTQSEVALCKMPDVSSEMDPEFDRDTLALDVHRALCMPLAWLPKRNEQSPPIRVSVLGAGACTLPLFLLEHYSPHELGRLDAIEPSSQVNAIAQRYFGAGAALQRDSRLVIHEKMGEDFLAEQEEDGVVDILMLDVEAGESCDGVRAPPLSMLDSSFLHLVKRLLAPHGILAVNVITESKEALEIVEARLGRVFPRGLRFLLSVNATFFLFNENFDDKSPLEVDEYVRLVRNSAFQTQHAQTSTLLDTYELTAWVSNSSRD